ncbi:hypothetical protein D3C84_739020 [compost metagenome]
MPFQGQALAPVGLDQPPAHLFGRLLHAAQPRGAVEQLDAGTEGQLQHVPALQFFLAGLGRQFQHVEPVEGLTVLRQGLGQQPQAHALALVRVDAEHRRGQQEGALGLGRGAVLVTLVDPGLCQHRGLAVVLDLDRDLLPLGGVDDASAGDDQSGLGKGAEQGGGEHDRQARQDWNAQHGTSG